MKTTLLAEAVRPVRRLRRGIPGLVLLLLIPALTLFAQIRICPSCGTEATEVATVCPHCGAALPPPAVAPVPETPPLAAPEATSAVRALSPDVGRADYEQFRRLMEAGDVWGARVWGRNATALMAINPDLAVSRAKLDADLIRLRSTAAIAKRTCPACQGKRFRHIQVTSLSGAVIEQDVSGAPCPVCHGAGWLPGRLTTTERNALMADARTAFELQQRSVGREEWMGIWLPAGAWETMPARQAAALRKAFGVDCSACSGWGRTACSNCGGAGKLACGNSGCAQGVEICPDCKGAGRRSDTTGNRTATVICSSCSGTGKRTCDTCHGEGVLDCSKCEGRGEMICARCNGSGQSAVCTKCGGTGLAICKTCNGAGKVGDAPCAACRGEGVTLCRSCEGAGRVAR